MAGDEIADRLARLERRLEWLQTELAEVRALVAADGATAPAPAPVAAPPPPPPVPPPPPPSEGLAAARDLAGRRLYSEAIDAGFAVLRKAEQDRDPALLAAVCAFAEEVVAVARGNDRFRAEQLRLRVVQQQRAQRTPALVSASPPAAPPPRTAEPSGAEPSGPNAIDRAIEWARSELTGPRAFAVAGGAVLVLGVIFFFVLAANRGWVGPAARVTLGAVASGLAVGAGVVVRLRYGRVAAAFGAVGAGIAGAYATLAAATVIYSYLPDWAALVAAAVIAAVGAALAVAWSSEILAGLALVGAAAAPALIALDDHPSWPGTAFALLVLAATIAVAAPRRWLWLLGVVAVIAGAQAAWLALWVADDSVGAVVVGCTAGLVLLGAAVAWQAYGGDALDAATTTFALSGAGLAFLCPSVVITDDVHLGLVLLALAIVYAAAALALGRRWRDLGWTIGAAALLLGGVAVAFLVSGRSLTIVWAIEAVVLAGLGWRLRALRFEAAGLGYLSAGIAHSLAIEIGPNRPSGAIDVPHGSAAGLFVLAAAAIAVGVLQPVEPALQPSSGVAAALDPFWNGLARARVDVRAALAVVAAILLGGGLAAVLSGRWLTLAVSALAAALGCAAFALGERRLQPFALGFLAFAVVHALAVEVPPRTLVPGTDTNVTAPVPSLVAIALASLVLAVLAVFSDRGIAWLGTVEGPELALDVLRREDGDVRAGLTVAAATAACWAAGLLAVDASYDVGLVVMTALWAVLGTGVVYLAARARSEPFQALGFVFVLLALVKSLAFDWKQLGDGGAAASLLVVASALLVSGFASRWVNREDPSPVEVVALCAGAGAAIAATVGLGRLFGYDSRWLGVAVLGVVAAEAAAGTAPYLRRRRGGAERWLRILANGYWAIALAALLFAERELAQGVGGTFALWGATAGVLALAWKPVAEDRAWMAGLVVGFASAFGTVAVVTFPSHLVHASPHPARGLWVLAVVVAAAWAIALTTPAVAAAYGRWILGVAAALTLYGLSLGVLEVAERVSGASVKTDFQRGHTALSALWGIGALALYVVGLARDIRDLRVVGLTLLGLALVKLFLYDLSSLSSITRALSFLAVGAILLAAGFFAERLVRTD